MQAHANFFEIKIIATLRKEQQFHLIKFAIFPDEIERTYYFPTAFLLFTYISILINTKRQVHSKMSDLSRKSSMLTISTPSSSIHPR